jgi:hypothetical protein
MPYLSLIPSADQANNRAILQTNASISGARMLLAMGIIPALRLRLIASSTQILGPNFGTGFRH